MWSIFPLLAQCVATNQPKTWCGSRFLHNQRRQKNISSCQHVWQFICFCGKICWLSTYPLVNKHSYWKWSFIVDLPTENGDFPYLMLVYQRVLVRQKSRQLHKLVSETVTDVSPCHFRTASACQSHTIGWWDFFLPETPIKFDGKNMKKPMGFRCRFSQQNQPNDQSMISGSLVSISGGPFGSIEDDWTSWPRLCGENQWCERWFINPMNTIVISYISTINHSKIGVMICTS